MIKGTLTLSLPKKPGYAGGGGNLTPPPSISHEDSGSQYKSPGLGLQGGLYVFRKSQKISTASDQYFLSYVKKLRGGVDSTLPQQE